MVHTPPLRYLYLPYGRMCYILAVSGKCGRGCVTLSVSPLAGHFERLKGKAHLRWRVSDSIIDLDTVEYR